MPSKLLRISCFSVCLDSQLSEVGSLHFEPSKRPKTARESPTLAHIVCKADDVINPNKRNSKRLRLWDHAYVVDLCLCNLCNLCICLWIDSLKLYVTSISILNYVKDQDIKDPCCGNWARPEHPGSLQNEPRQGLGSSVRWHWPWSAVFCLSNFRIGMHCTTFSIMFS